MNDTVYVETEEERKAREAAPQHYLVQVTCHLGVLSAVCSGDSREEAVAAAIDQCVKEAMMQDVSGGFNYGEEVARMLSQDNFVIQCISGAEMTRKLVVSAMPEAPRAGVVESVFSHLDPDQHDTTYEREYGDDFVEDEIQEEMWQKIKKNIAWMRLIGLTERLPDEELTDEDMDAMIRKLANMRQ